MSTSDAESLAQDMNEELEEKAFTMEKDTESNEVEGLEKEEEKVTVMDPIEVEKGIGGDSGVSVVSDFLINSKKLEIKWCRALLGLRIAAFVFCLKAFSVLATDKQKVLVESLSSDYTYTFIYTYRWFDYDEFKYSFSANLIGFVYSWLQIFDQVRYLITKKHIVNTKLRGYFNIAMDQALAYVLMSASSSAATAIRLNESNWAIDGANIFTAKANASVALSFLAFLAFALASVVSGCILARFT